MRRRNNQDNHGVFLAANEVAWNKSGHLLIVADGMGAHAAGELASQLAVELISHHYGKLSHNAVPEILQQSFIEANAEIYRRGQANPEFRSMGTTACALILSQNGASLAHVGDSRIYRLRDGVMEQLTFDHSLVWEMRATGDISDEMLQNSTIPKNVITRSLGPNPSVAIDLEGPFDLRKGDRFLLCSDGLSGQLSDSELGTLLQLLDLNSAVQSMIDIANLRGGPDNITVVVGEVLTDEFRGQTQAANGNDAKSRSQASFPLPLGLASGVGLLLTLFLFSLGHVAIALLSLAITIAVFSTGWHRYTTPLLNADRGNGSRGTSPYVRVKVKPDATFASNLQNVVSELEAWFVENRWTIVSNGIAEARAKARKDESVGNYKGAIVGYVKIILQMMDEARRLQNSPQSEDSGVIDL